MALHALILTVFDHLSLLGVLLFYYLVMLMHMFLFMFTCMEERPAISRADFQTRIESRQLDELHKCPYLHNSSRASTFNSLQFHFDSRLCPKLEQNLHANSEHWSAPFPFTRTSRVPRPFFHNCYIHVFSLNSYSSFMSDLCRLLDHLCTKPVSCVQRACNFRISF